MNLGINIFHFTNLYSTDISDICLFCNNLFVCLFVFQNESVARLAVPGVTSVNHV